MGATAAEALPVQQLFEPLARIAAGGEDGDGVAAECVDDLGRIDAASAGRLAARFDVGAILEGQPVDADGPVDRRVDRKSDNQVVILRRKA
jgi:hypothetical protein